MKIIQPYDKVLFTTVMNDVLFVFWIGLIIYLVWLTIKRQKMFEKFLNWLYYKKFERNTIKNIKSVIDHPEDFIKIDDGSLPTDLEILQSYEKYCIKIKSKNDETINDKYEWHTSLAIETPDTYEEYSKLAKEHGRRFLWSSTASYVIGTPFCKGGMTYVQ